MRILMERNIFGCTNRIRAYNKYVSTVLTVLIFFCIILLNSGCVSIAPWEKCYLADPIMQFTIDQKSSIHEQHTLNARESSSGGYGGAGGGCGCK